MADTVIVETAPMILNDAPLPSTSGVSWPAVIGGAVAAAALTLALLALGSGFGLASVSPWSPSPWTGMGASAKTFTVVAAIWLIVTQWFASGVGGYLAGRLRTKWVGLHTHEVFFRDTANGFLAWATASVIAAAFLASAASSIIGGTTTMVTGAASTAAAATYSDPAAWFVDGLYRTDHPSTTVSDADVRAQSTRILVTGMRNGDVPAADKTYLAQLVSARTGLSPDDAEKRVDDVITQAKAAELKARQAADVARKAASRVSIVTGLSMLIGAFIACIAACLGGQRRDAHM